MLPQFYSFHVDNQGDATVNMAFTCLPWKFAADGSLEYGAQFQESGSINAGQNGIVGAQVDNSADLWLGLHVNVAFTNGGSGTLTAYLMLSGADQLTWAIASVTNPATGSLTVGVEI